MKQPTDLLQTLLQDESAETAVVVYKEAGSYAQQYKDVQAAALACAQADLDGGKASARRPSALAAGPTRKASPSTKKPGKRPSPPTPTWPLWRRPSLTLKSL
jgi:hypothetical protein